MIQFLLLQNRQGKTRLSKYYRSYGDEEKVKLEAVGGDACGQETSPPPERWALQRSKRVTLEATLTGTSRSPKNAISSCQTMGGSSTSGANC